MTVVTNENGDLVMQDPLKQEILILNGTGEKGDKAEEIKLRTSDKFSSQHTQNDSKLQKEMEICFSFNGKEEKGETNGNIDILQTIL